jgi:hypothetical protein
MPGERKWSPRPGLNWRPHPYQGCALPLSHVGKRNGNLDRSGRWDSNPRHPAWKAGALPTELHPREPCELSALPAKMYPRFHEQWRGKDSNLRSPETADLQSAPFGHSGTPPGDETKRKKVLVDGSRLFGCQVLVNSRAGGGTRTRDPLITSQALYLLSYASGITVVS